MAASSRAPMLVGIAERVDGRSNRHFYKLMEPDGGFSVLVTTEPHGKARRVAKGNYNVYPVKPASIIAYFNVRADEGILTDAQASVALYGLASLEHLDLGSPDIELVAVRGAYVYSPEKEVYAQRRSLEEAPRALRGMGGGVKSGHYAKVY